VVADSRHLRIGRCELDLGAVIDRVAVRCGAQHLDGVRVAVVADLDGCRLDRDRRRRLRESRARDGQQEDRGEKSGAHVYFAPTTNSVSSMSRVLTRAFGCFGSGTTLAESFSPLSSPLGVVGGSVNFTANFVSPLFTVTGGACTPGGSPASVTTASPAKPFCR